MEDLLTYGEGLEVAERELLVSEVGVPPQSLPDQVIAVVRDEKVYRYFDPVVTLLARGDRLVVVRPAKELPWAPRPGTHNEDFAAEDRGLTGSGQARAALRQQHDLVDVPRHQVEDLIGAAVVASDQPVERECRRWWRRGSGRRSRGARPARRRWRPAA